MPFGLNNVHYQIVDIKAQVTLYDQINLMTGNNQGQIDVSAFAPVMYWISLSTDDGTRTTRQFIVK